MYIYFIFLFSFMHPPGFLGAPMAATKSGTTCGTTYICPISIICPFFRSVLVCTICTWISYFNTLQLYNSEKIHERFYRVEFNYSTRCSWKLKKRLLFRFLFYAVLVSRYKRLSRFRGFQFPGGPRSFSAQGDSNLKGVFIGTPYIIEDPWEPKGCRCARTKGNF